MYISISFIKNFSQKLEYLFTFGAFLPACGPNHLPWIPAFYLHRYFYSDYNHYLDFSITSVYFDRCKWSGGRHPTRSPFLWILLPVFITEADSVYDFRSLLQTFLFNKAYSQSWFKFTLCLSSWVLNVMVLFLLFFTVVIYIQSCLLLLSCSCIYLSTLGCLLICKPRQRCFVIQINFVLIGRLSLASLASHCI